MIVLRVALLPLLLALACVTAFPRQAHAAPLDYDITAGHFYSQANGEAGAGGSGFSVTDKDGIAFWSEFQRLGGVAVLGYPISHRFIWKGTVVQAFQKVVMQWQPATASVSFVNIFDELRDAGKDEWLKVVCSTPKQVWLENESSLGWSEVARQRQAFLDVNPKIKAAYFAVADPVMMFGLPASRVEDMGNAFVVRLQRAVIQQWKVNTPWAKAGEVTIANGGDIGKQSGILPADALQPSGPDGAVAVPQAIAPASGARTVVIDPGHGDKEIGASYRFADGVVLLEKDINLKIAQRVATLLRGAGYRVVLTRDADVAVNRTGADLNGDGKVTADDDLQARIDIANKEKANVLVSVHNNGHPSPDQHGTEVYYNDKRPFASKNLRLAQILQRSLVSSLASAGYNTLDRGIRTDASIKQGESFYILGPQGKRIARSSEMPAALGESLFVSNPTDAAQLRSDTMIQAIARGYAVGISQFLSTDS